MSKEKPLLDLCGKRAFNPPLGTPEEQAGTRMRTLMSHEGIDLANYCFDSNGKYVPGKQRYLNAKRLAMSICDDQGNLVYDEEDVATLADLPEPVMEMLIAKFMSMQRAEYVPEFLKNVAPAT